MTIQDARKALLLFLVVVVLLTFSYASNKANKQDEEFAARSEAYSLATQFLDEGNYEQAAALTTSLLQSKQKTELVHSLHGQILLKLENPLEAKHHFEQALKINPHLVEDSYFLYNLGLALKESNFFAEAIEVFKTSLAAAQELEAEEETEDLIQLVNEQLKDLNS